MEHVQGQLGHVRIHTTIRFYSHMKPGLNQHYASNFRKRTSNRLTKSYFGRDGIGHHRAESAAIMRRKRALAASILCVA
jgi:hypothetical protein